MHKLTPTSFSRVPFFQSRKFEIYRLILTFVICQTIGSLLYFIFALKFGSFPRLAGTILSIVIQFINCAMILFEIVRIVIFISIPSLLTGRFRALLLVLILTWSIQISGMNVTSNLKGAAEGIICVQQRVKTMANEFKEGADKNLRQIPIEKLQRFFKKSMQPFVEIREILRNMDDSLTRMLSWQRSLILKIKNVINDCNIHAQVPFHACISTFTYLHSECAEHTFDILCAPIKLLKHICYITKVLELHCEWPKLIKNQMEEGVDYFVKQSKRQALAYAQKTVFYDVYAKVFICFIKKNYYSRCSEYKKEFLLKISTSGILKDGKGAEKSYNTLEIMINHTLNFEEKLEIQTDEFRAELRKEVGYVETFFDVIDYFNNFVFLVILILPLIFAIKYIKKFKTDVSADNYFITQELIELNKRQKFAGYATIFPLDEDEKKKYIYWKQRRIVSSECKNLIFSITITFLSIGVPIVFVASDLCTFKILNRGYQFFHSNNTRLARPNTYHLKVTGEGFMFQLLSNILHTFEPLSTDSNERDSMWHDCFIEPIPPSYSLFNLMFYMFVVSILLCFAQVYTKRFRHMIANYYFPAHVIPRVVYLQNKILEERFAKEHPGDEYNFPEMKLPNKTIQLSTSSSSSSL